MIDEKTYLAPTEIIPICTRRGYFTDPPVTDLARSSIS